MNTPQNVVGFILKGFPRLSETFIINEILLLEELGFRLHIFALRNPGETSIHEKVHRIRAKITYIPDYFWRFLFPFLRINIRLWRRNPELYRQAFSFALLCSLRERNSAPLKRFVQAAYLAENSLPGTGVIHFHAHFSHDPTTVAFFASWLTGLNYSFSAHAKDIYLQSRDFLREKIARAQFVVTCTEYNKNYLEKIGRRHVPVLRCYHGIDLDIFSGSGKSKPNSCPHILSIGRLVPKKGFPVLIEALFFLRRQGFHFRCTIIGNGPLKQKLQEKISDLMLDDWVKILPPMSQHRILQYYRTADLFALACEVDKDGDRDGIPNVIVEAMAMGIPVVSTHVSGIPECLESGVNGILAAEKDPRAFAEGMIKILRNPRLACQFAGAGRKKVEQCFDMRRNVVRIGAVLRRAMETNDGHPEKNQYFNLAKRPFEVESKIQETHYDL